jgi:hypothetical protein
LGLDLGGAEQREFAVGAATTRARRIRTSLRVGPWAFEAPVWFADPWPLTFSVLGQEGFFVYFRVTLSALEGWVECEPEPQAPISRVQ